MKVDLAFKKTKLAMTSNTVNEASNEMAKAAGVVEKARRCQWWT